MDWINKFCNMMYPVDPKDLNIEGAFLLKQQNLPKSIFKYSQVNEYSLRNLSKDTIWLSSPQKFNDPYDCSHCANFSVLSEKILYKDLKKLPNIDEIKKGIPPHALIEIENSENQFTELKKQITLLIQKEYPDSADKILNVLGTIEQKLYDDLSKNSSERIKDSFKVCSFTTNRDSILMWSHYADFHKGFCIEYDLSKFSYGDFQTRFLYPVMYSDNIADTTELLKFSIGNENFNNLYYSLAALVKSKEWSYEDEWRIVFAHGMFEKDRSYPMNKPKAIYLGSKISLDNQKIIVDIATQKGIEIFKMKLEPNTFKLTPSTITDAEQYFFKQKKI